MKPNQNGPESAGPGGARPVPRRPVVVTIAALAILAAGTLYVVLMKPLVTATPEQLPHDPPEKDIKPKVGDIEGIGKDKDIEKRGEPGIGMAFGGKIFKWPTDALCKVRGEPLKALSDRPFKSRPPYKVAGRGAKRDSPTPPADFREDLRPGTLTAGNIDDTQNPEFFRSLASKLSRKMSAGVFRAFEDSPIILVVRDTAGNPVWNARLRIEGARTELVTRSDGKAVLVPGWDRLKGPLKVTVLPPGGGQETLTIKEPSGQNLIVVPAPEREPVYRIEIAFILDCTASMSDELEYLKVELRDVSREIHRLFPRAEQRFGLVAYRDTGDVCMSQRFDFEPLDAFLRHLGAQRAAGGGDYPEAVHTALREAGRLSWTPGNTIRVAFHVADAPPHDEHVRDALTAVDALRTLGVSVYPVAASGIDDMAEFTMRATALLTGSRYLFLTDDSGVGASHREPNFPNYNVEPLRDLLVRVVCSEIFGQFIEGDPAEVIRTVRRDAGPPSKD